MNTITLAKGNTKYETLQTYRSAEMYEGSMRNILTLVFDREKYSLDELDKIFRDKEYTSTIQSESVAADGTKTADFLEDFTITGKVSSEKATTLNPTNNPDIEIPVANIVCLVKQTTVEIQNEKILAALAKLGVEI